MASWTHQLKHIQPWHSPANYIAFFLISVHDVEKVISSFLKAHIASGTLIK